MHSPRRWSALVAVAVFLPLGLAGCGQPVREDRTITWSGEGRAVGFQHGQEGVFVADREGGRLTRIFQPGPDVLASSTPLWSPDGRQVIFTTARDPQGQPAAALPWPWRGDAAGAVHFQQPVVYTCWLSGPTGEGPPSPPVPLFEAACDHVGYVAANLAVRWQPDGKRILHVKQVGEHRHGLFAFDLGTRRSVQVFPHTGEALLFDASPDGERLVCVLGGAQPQPTEGIWVGTPEGGWWQVPHAGGPAPGELSSVLEQLRATRPAWTSDGARFAFPSYQAGPGPGQPGRFSLWAATPAARQVVKLAEGPEAFRDLHWAPDGLRLGVVRGAEAASLHLVGPDEPLSPPLNGKPVRRFIGWNAAGDRLAYVVPDPLPLAGEPAWAFLLLPDSSARDAVVVAGGRGEGPVREVFAGMRVTFPQWSPREDKLSLWVTFVPCCRSWVSLWLGGGLRPGDPAAVFDVPTGRLGWMAVNAHEKAQVGHYYLLKRDYAEAWRWYEQAEQEAPPAPAASRSLTEYLRDPAGPRDISLFQYQCLNQLGRKRAARARLAQFRERFTPPAAGANGPGQPTEAGADAWLRDLLAPPGLAASLLRDFYAAEVFLGIDAAEDGEAFFREEFANAASDAARFSSALVWSQLLLLERKHEAYAELVTDKLAPLLDRARPPAPGTAGSAAGAEELFDLMAGFALAPLAAPGFLAGLPEDQVRSIADRWQEVRRAASTDATRYRADLVLRAAHQRLGQEAERRRASDRLRNNPAIGRGPFHAEDGDQEVERIRQAVRDLLRWWRGS